MDLIGTASTVSGGNSQAPVALIDPSLQPTLINQPSDATGLVSTGRGSAVPSRSPCSTPPGILS